MVMTDREERMLLEMFDLKRREAETVSERWKNESSTGIVEDDEALVDEQRFAEGRALAWGEASILLNKVINS